jgi:hypothetical protein
MTVSVPLDNLKVGDLYDFVDLARGAGVTRDSEVDVWKESYRASDDEFGADRLELTLLDGAARKAPDFSGLDRAALVEALDVVIAQGGDARYALDEIKLIRDRLLL